MTTNDSRTSAADMFAYYRRHQPDTLWGEILAQLLTLGTILDEPILTMEVTNATLHDLFEEVHASQSIFLGPDDRPVRIGSFNIVQVPCADPAERRRPVLRSMSGHTVESLIAAETADDG